MPTGPRRTAIPRVARAASSFPLARSYGKHAAMAKAKGVAKKAPKKASKKPATKSSFAGSFVGR